MNVLELVTQGDCSRLIRYLTGNRNPSQINLENVDYYGNTALLKSCYMGNFRAMEILLDMGASLKAINYFGQNALTLATYSGNTDIVRHLLKYRSYSDFTLSSMIPPFCVASMQGYQDIKTIFANFKYFDINKIKTVHGLTPAHFDVLIRSRK